MRRARTWVLVPLAVSLVVGLFGIQRLDVSFSPSFEGFNAAVWATGSMAVQKQGWMDSRLGGRRGDTSYAHHPPLAQIEASVAGATLGDHRWAFRLAALVSTIAAIWCCWGWLGALDFSPGPRSLGLLVASGTSLGAAYAVMLNMEVVWMPFGFALLWAWCHARSYDVVPRRLLAICGVLAVIGSLAAHQGILLAAGLGLVGMVTARRGHRPTQALDRTMLAAAAAGAAGFLAWVVWVTGGTSDLWRIAEVRSSDGVGWLRFAGAQASNGLSLFGFIGLVALVCGMTLLILRDTQRRPIGIVVVASILAYSLVFRQGATIHEYWNAPLLPAVALGAAAIGEHLSARSQGILRVAVVIAAANFLLVALGTPKAPPIADVGTVVHLADTDGNHLYTVETEGAWASYEAGGPVLWAPDCRDVHRISREDSGASIVASEHWVQEHADYSTWETVSRSASIRRPGAALVSPSSLDDAVCTHQ